MPDDAIAMGSPTLLHCDIVQLRQCEISFPSFRIQILSGSCTEHAVGHVLRLGSGVGDDEVFPSIQIGGGDEEDDALHDIRAVGVERGSVCAVPVAGAGVQGMFSLENVG